MARVRTRDAALGRLLAAAPGAIYALDDQRRIVYCNPACGDLLGVDPDTLIGQRCEYRTSGQGSGPPDMAASLSPPPDVFAGRRVTAEMELLHAQGHLIAREVTFEPLGTDALNCVGVLGIVGDLAVADRSQAEAAELHRRLWKLRRSLAHNCEVDELIGVSPVIQRVRSQIDLAAHGRLRVVVFGPNGSGREHVARLLHRRAMPERFVSMVPLCCPLQDAELLQTTITSLVRQVSEANADANEEQLAAGAPTLLLLEVDQLSDEAQAELAGFLALPDFELYAIATSGLSLIELARQGRFRTDLAYALSTLTIELPPLAQRREDIPLLAQYFLEKFNAAGDRQLSGFAPEAVDELVGYHWPENVEELAELVESACKAAEGPVVERRDLPRPIQWARTADAHPKRPDEPIELDAFLAEIERELILRALRRCRGNKTKAAQLLGINRARFHRRLEHFRIK